MINMGDGGAIQSTRSRSKRRVSWVEVWEDPEQLPREYPISTKNSKPKTLEQYKKRYPNAFSISVRDRNGYEEQLINPNYGRI